MIPENSNTENLIPSEINVASHSLMQEKVQMQRASRLHWIHWLVIVLSLLLTFSAWYFTKQQVEEKINLQFNREAEQVMELISERMRKYEDVLWGGVSAVQSHGGEIGYLQWKKYAKSLNIEKQYPGINGIGLILNINSTDVPAYLAQQRKKRPTFKIHPPHENSTFLPITYIEPEQSNAKAVGLDMAHETNRFTAAIRARDTGTAQITGPIVLVQDSGKTPGFLFYAPYYKEGVAGTLADRRKNFTGLIYAPFVVKKLMEGTLEKQRRHVGVQIKDGNQVLYDEHRIDESDFDPKPMFKKTYPLFFYGRDWSFDIRSTLSFREAAQNNQPVVILIGGILIDIMIVVLFIIITGSNRRAIDFGTRMSKNYQQKTEELEDMVGELAESNEELERFAYVASHDLQEPLRMISSFTELLGEEYGAKLDDAGKQYIGLVTDSAERMQLLISDLLEYARLGHEADRFTTVDCTLEMQHVLENLDEEVRNYKAEITYDDLPRIQGNPVRFMRLLQNLIGNAIKYCPEGRTPVIHVGVEDIGDSWQFSIADNGIGMKEEYVEQIFIPFKRLHTKQEYSGTGMGLAICRKIVENMSGKIWARSTKDEGSVFYFRLPKQQANQTGVVV